MFYFPNMLCEVRSYVQACQVCQRRRGELQRRARLQCPGDVTYPLEKVSADLLHLPDSDSGYRYVLSIIDHHSRYLQLIPLASRDVNTVANAFIEDYVTIFGPPRYLITDNGAEFTGTLFQRVCAMLSIRLGFTIAYHPQSNGMVHLAINSAIHRSTGEQPLYLLTGRHGHFPVGITNDTVFDTEADIAERLRVARQCAVEATRRARENWTRTYNAKVRPSSSSRKCGPLFYDGAEGIVDVAWPRNGMAPTVLPARLTCNFSAVCSWSRFTTL
ncbi:uncharacterized protein LOC119578331 [Penaeus monodon]|uniref:uncharacterized protein LOC119578331 n=1 Tax=Penaeus monodon TaxID=6687 RepID=UPI0018A76E9D|nr:uncharacterized protein LOC119578331 [Penaeus monodon]